MNTEEKKAFTFIAEIIKVEVKKTASLDKEYKIILVTDNPQAIALSQFINETSVQLDVQAIA